MSEITPELLSKLASLARIELHEAESNRLAGELQRIFRYMEKLNELDTSAVEPMSHLHGDTNRYRADRIVEYPAIERILENVPERSGNFVRVPIILDQGPR